jgi:hypothetical protein
MNQDLRARFDALRNQLAESVATPQPVQLPVGFEHMTVAELNRWIETRRNDV